jgi:Mn2+/Fe2+ NRAMP family transporter
MKKLLSIFGAIGLVVTPMSSFSISCSSPKSLPHYNSDGDFNEQVSDAWDTSILKTVSTWINRKILLTNYKQKKMIQIL